MYLTENDQEQNVSSALVLSYVRLQVQCMYNYGLIMLVNKSCNFYWFNRFFHELIYKQTKTGIRKDELSIDAGLNNTDYNNRGNVSENWGTA